MTDDFYFTFNARHLKPSEVAESFIWSNSFAKLIQNNHSVILGARGCGKTTLMKMLTLPALYSWDNNKAKEIINGIPFYSVYISTDIYWNVKDQTYNAQLKPFGNLADLISIFSVTSNVFTSVCDTFQSIIEFELKDFDEIKEFELCKKLIQAWKLKPTIPKFSFIKEALLERVDQLNQTVQNLIFNYTPDQKIPHFDFLDLRFDTSLELVIPVFERIYGISGKKKWALCFDELEFAPIWLQIELFRSLRSRTQYVLYKLSASPILPREIEESLNKKYGASPGNDVQIIKMWGSSDSERFSKLIIESLVKKKLRTVSALSYFGSNKIYSKNNYDEGGDFEKVILSLISKDQSFSKFLVSKKVDLINPLKSDIKNKDTIFRKIKPIVYFRNHHIKEAKNSGEISMRSRNKTIELFHGFEVLYKICDGNPRWLMGLISSILQNSVGDFADKEIQHNEILKSAERFKNVIGNIPIGENNNMTIVDVIDRIGNYFNSQILGYNFTMDPKGTFEVDSNDINLQPQIIELLEKAISQGAIIPVDSGDGYFDFDIRNKRFKLSYLFFILYRLPLRTYDSAKLSECLDYQRNGQLNQMSLFK